VEKYDKAGQATDDNTALACHIIKGTDTHPEYVILIAFPLQQWLRERAPVLPYMYIASLVKIWI
jgi:hypothetical protein